MTRPNGGPAFPANTLDVPFEEANHPKYAGMTLRDYFAAKVLAMGGEFFHNQSTGETDSISAIAYRVADAMLAERER